jgi:hypothetical protein
MKNILSKIFYPLAFLSASGVVFAKKEYNEQWLYGLLKNIIGIGKNILFILAVGLILWAAFSFLTSSGDEKRIAKAKNTLIYAIVAIILGLLAFVITGFIANLIGEPIPAY